MAFQAVFKRYELKYMLTYEQKQLILDEIVPFMVLDEYGRTTIRNIYFDTDSFRLIRHSVEKPAYKEKLRIRSYSLASPESRVFVELKKKYDGVVYKRRVDMTEAEAMAWLTEGSCSPMDTQISREIDYFMSHYSPLVPKVFLSYEREAFCEIDGGDFRVTFDDNIFARVDDLSLCLPPRGVAVLPEGRVLMEIKCSGAIPLWMTEILSRHKIYKTSFSKYGRAYLDHILPGKLNIEEQKEIISHA